MILSDKYMYMSYVFQILKINSNSLVSLSLNNVGITGLVLDNCPNLSKLSGTDQDCIYFLILLYKSALMITVLQ